MFFSIPDDRTIGLGQQSAEFLCAPDVVTEARFLCRSAAQRLMDAAVVVVHTVKCDHMSMLLDFLAVIIRESRKAAISHPKS